MGNYEQLIAAIKQVIKTNGNNEITGAILQDVLVDMVYAFRDSTPSFDSSAMWQLLGAATPEQINVSHLSATDVAGMLTQAGYKLTDTFDTYFGVDEDGNIYVKDNRGFYGNSFVSARGGDPEAGGSTGQGIDISAMWYALGQPTGEKINASHIPALPISQITGLQSALSTKLEGITKPMVEKVLTGTITSHNHDGRYAPLSGGLIPPQYLPSYMDDVLEYASKTAFPATGEAGKIYVALDTNLTYRWGGSAYVEISPSLALGHTSSTAYPGDEGAALAALVEGMKEITDLFGIDEDGNVYVTGNRGFYGNSFISARGSDPEAGSGGGGGVGIDMTSVWYALGQPTNEKINVSHIPAIGMDKVSGLADALAGKLSGITGEMVTEALGYTPYDAEGISSASVKYAASAGKVAHALSIVAGDVPAVYDGSAEKSVTVPTAEQMAMWNKIAELFDVDADGNVYVTSNRGFWSSSFISARGSDPGAGSGGGSGVDMESVWYALGQPTTEKINVSHIPALQQLSGTLTNAQLANSSITVAGVEVPLGSAVTTAQIASALTAAGYKLTDTAYTLSSFGITATAAEINRLDGITASTAELNFVDGVTSNIQTQLNAKANASALAAYALKDGSNASGTWPISVSGTATYATVLSSNSSTSVSNYLKYCMIGRQTSLVGSNAVNGAWCLPTTGGDAIYGNGQILRFGWAQSYYTDLHTGPNEIGSNSGLQFRQVVAGAVSSLGWRTLLDTANYATLIDSRYVKKSGDTMNGTLTLLCGGDNYDQGIRINRPTLADWATLTIGCVGSGTSGTTANTWLIGTPANSNSLIFCLNASSDQKGLCLRDMTNAGMRWNGYVVWNAGCQGSGSGLDADLLDGYQSTSFNLATNLGACQDYGVYVIGLMQITDYTTVGNMANGTLIFIRQNGNNPAQKIIYSLSTQYGSNNVRFGYLTLSTNIYVQPCTFTYNGKKWAGFQVSSASSYRSGVVCVRDGLRLGERSTPFLLKYGVSNTGAVINSEVNSSVVINGADIIESGVHSNAFFGNASSATKLATARLLWGRSFDGSGDIRGNIIVGDAIIHGSVTSNNTRFISSDNASNIYFSVGGLVDLVAEPSCLRRGVSNTSETLGTSTYRWANVYAVNGDYSGNMTVSGWINNALILSHKGVSAGNSGTTTFRINGHILEFGGRGYAHQNYYFRPQYSASGKTYADMYIQNASAADSPVFVTTHYFDHNGYAYHSGHVGIGMAPTGNRLDVAGTIHSTTGIWSNGYVSAKGQDTTSDARYKRDVAALPAQAALSVLMRLRPSTWAWKDDGRRGAGFVAQEVLGVLPEAVREVGDGEDRHLALNYQMLHAYEVSMLQTHETELERLRSRVNQLENEIKRKDKCNA